MQEFRGALRATENVDLDLFPGEIQRADRTQWSRQSPPSSTRSPARWRSDTGTIRFLGQRIDSLRVPQRAQLGLGRSFQVSSLAPEFSALRNVMLAVQPIQGSSFHFFKPVMRGGHAGVEPAMAALDRVGWPAARTYRPPNCRMASAGNSRIAIALALGSKAFLLDRADGRHGPGRGSKTLTRFLDGLRHEATDPADRT